MSGLPLLIEDKWWGGLSGESSMQPIGSPPDFLNRTSQGRLQIQGGGYMQVFLSQSSPHIPRRFQLLQITWNWNIDSTVPTSRVHKFYPYHRYREGRCALYVIRTFTNPHKPPAPLYLSLSLLPISPMSLPPEQLLSPSMTLLSVTVPQACCCNPLLSPIRSSRPGVNIGPQYFPPPPYSGCWDPGIRVPLLQGQWVPPKSMMLCIGFKTGWSGSESLI